MVTKPRYTFFLAIKWMLLPLVLTVLGLASRYIPELASSEPSSPLLLSTQFVPDPEIPSAFSITIYINSSVDFQEASLEIRADSAVDFDEWGWQGSIKADTPFELTFEGEVTHPGSWAIAPYISATTGSTRFGAGDTVQIQYIDGEICLIPDDVGTEYVQGPYLNWDKSKPFPEMIRAPKQLASTNMEFTLQENEETAHFYGVISYEARDQFEIRYDQRPLPFVRVEVWDINEGELRLISTSPAYARADGTYSISVPAIEADGTGIDPLLLVFATDDMYVDVQYPTGVSWFYIGFYPGFDIQSGEHPFDIVLNHQFDLEPFFVFDTIRRIGHNKLANDVGWETDDKLAVRWPATCVDLEHKKSCYFYEKVYLNEEDGWDPDVILHEYTHFVLARPEYYGNERAIASCLFQYPPFEHFFNKHITKSCAWNEGWADFLEAALQGEANYVDTFEDGLGNVNVSINQDFEAPNNLPEVPQDGISNADVEGSVTAVLWDLFDSPSDNMAEDEDFDEVGFRLNGPDENGIWTLTTNHTPGNIVDFWNDWDASGNGQECRVSTIMREYGIPLGPIPYYLETQTQPTKGTIEVSPNPDCPFNKYSQDTTVTLNAVPKPGYEFLTWSLTPSVPLPNPPVEMNNPSILLNIDRNWTVEALFSPVQTSTPMPPSTIRIPISSGEDDAGDKPPYPTIGSCSYLTFANEIYFGECPDGKDITSGFRFRNIGIPQNAIIQNAYLSFSVNGPYTNPLTLSIYGQNSGDAVGFNSGSRPDSRPKTASSVVWDIPSTDTWGLGNERNTPDISSIIQEIVNRLDWSSGNDLAIIITDNGEEGGQHRRVIGYERPSTTYDGHVAELVVTYQISGGGPGPTATPTPSPSPTGTPEPSPTPCECAITCAIGFASTSGSTAEGPGNKLPGLLSMFSRSLDFISVLQELRDEIMLQTDDGQQFNDLYINYSTELTSIFLQHDDLWEQGIDTIDLFADDFEALLAGQADEVFITQGQVEAVEEFIDFLYEAASPELKSVINQQRESINLKELAGKSFAQAQGQLLNNNPPEAITGGPYSVEEGSSIPLLGSARDPEHDSLYFRWDLNNDGIFESDGSLAMFSAQNKDGPDSVPVHFKVCDDKGACDVESVVVQIQNVAPTVDAGPDQIVYRLETIELVGSWTDPAGILDTPYLWTWDLDGDGLVDRSEPTGYGKTIEESVSFELEGNYTLTFSVMDKDGGISSDTVEIEVLNRPPVCDQAYPSLESLWPANHKFVPIEIQGVTDLEGDLLILTIASIFQDEIVDDGGDGNTEPDGQGVGTSIAEVRAERSANGNGRFYHITFNVNDGHGGVCMSEVLVRVPFSKSIKVAPVNEGPLYDSTIPISEQAEV